MAFAILDFEFDTHLYISLIIKKPSCLFFSFCGDRTHRKVLTNFLNCTIAQSEIRKRVNLLFEVEVNSDPDKK